ncbi:MAG: sugar transferase, partial [Terrimesophilobacter sp.]
MSEVFVPHPFGAGAPDLRLTARGTPPSARPLHLVPSGWEDSRLNVEAEAKSGPVWVKHYQWRLRLTDTAVVAVCTLIAFFGRPGAIASGNSRGFAFQLGLAALAAILWGIALSSFRTRGPRTLGLGAMEYKRVAAASNMTAGVFAIIALVLGVESARWFIIVAYPVGVASLLVSRWLWRRWLTGQRAEGHYLSQVVVVGNRTDVEGVVRQIDHAPGAAFTVVGAVIDGTAKQIHSGPLKGLSRSFNLDRAADFADALGADAVVVAGHPKGGHDFIRDLAWKLEGTHAELVLATSLANIAGPRIHLRPVDGLPLIHVEIPQFEGGKHVLKRVFD